jgi:NodT family efflux transporter outer membrane factor (OMF) lipoprotein
MERDTMGNLSKKYLRFFSILLLFCSCHQEVKKAEISPALTLHEPLSEAFTSIQFCKGGWPQRQWWEFFEDNQLSYLIEKAIRQNPTLQQAQAKWISSQEYAKIVRSKLFPNLTGSYEETWTYFGKNGFVLGFYPLPPTLSPPQSANIIDLSLNLSYEFDFWGKNRMRYQAALGSALMELAETIQAELVLSTMVAFAYFEFQTHQTIFCLKNKILDDLNSSLQLIVKKNQVGVDSLFPNISIDEKILTISKELVEIKKNIEIDLVVLKNLVGEGPDSLIRVELAPLLFNKTFPIPENVGLDLLGRRPDLIAMIWNTEAKSKEIGVARTEFYPNISIGANGGFETLHFNTLFSNNSLTGTLVPAVSLPLFTGGRLEGNLNNKIAQYNEAVYQYNSGLLNAVKEVSCELFQLKALFDLQETQKKKILNRKMNEDLTQQLYEKGLDNIINFYFSRMETVEQQIQNAQIENNRMASMVRLFKSLGGGFQTLKLPESQQ